MSWGGALGLALLAAGAHARVVGARAASVGTVTIAGPAGDTVADITPRFVVRTSGFASGERPLWLIVEISRDPLFGTLLLADSASGDSAAIRLARPLPQNVAFYWRAVARAATGDSAVSVPSGPHVTRAWLTLIAPNSATGSTLATPRPTFVWSSAPVAAPPGPWRYDLTIVNAARVGAALRFAALTDTTFTPPADLESNTSYRWAVTARLASGDSTRVQSLGTFVIVDPSVPPATVLFQNFPNPFPSSTAASTCVWFDLHRSSDVSLQVFDIRGQLVRTLIPSAVLGSAFAAGRYGRAAGAPQGAGCDTRFTWDGTDNTGRVAPPGVYLLRLRADGIVTTRKMLFRGR